ncbi:hypothetical protein ALT721_800092 [Alteromonas alvinellae]
MRIWSQLPLPRPSINKYLVILKYETGMYRNVKSFSTYFVRKLDRTFKKKSVVSLLSSLEQEPIKSLSGD